jgi:sulfhydrogenase subunit delta
MTKPRVAVFDFADCEGCELQIANLEEELLDLLNIIELVEFREVMTEKTQDYDIAIIEGSIMRPIDEERLKDIRTHAKILIALGACAATGCVNTLRNQWTPEEVKKEVYGDAASKIKPELMNVGPARALNEVVPVDYYIHGCPINPDEFKTVVTSLVLGKKPEIPNYPVCVECKKNENVCQFELGYFCLGPITRAGCNARCPTQNAPCDGCRGILKKPETQCVQELVTRYDLTYEELKARCTMFNSGKEACK